MYKIFAIINLILFILASSATAEDFKLVKPGYQFNFPRDHGSHTEYPLEWWYFTGHLKTPKSRAFGFQLTFFRLGIHNTESKSNWASDSLYLAHFAITDDLNKQFLFSSKFSRPNFKISGAESDNLKVWIDDWIAQKNSDYIILAAKSFDSNLNKDYALRLTLKPEKRLTLHGENGYSAKGTTAGQASLYMSYTRLLGSGELTIAGEKFPIYASAWMDHEVLSFDANSSKLGWDWFGIQLDNGDEFMFFKIHEISSKSVTYSAGTYINKNGTSENLTAQQVQVAALSEWKSERTNVSYPAKWNIKIPHKNLELIVTPTIQNQEITSSESAARTYWEGRCKVSGKINEQEISGNAYTELVGYN